MNKNYPFWRNIYRSGDGAVYHGKEYEAFLSYEKIRMYSQDPQSLNEGFVQEEGYFVKEVLSGEVSERFRLNVRAQYKGHAFSVLRQDCEDKTFTLLTEERALAESLGFTLEDRWYWVKIVPVSDLEKIWTEREVLPPPPPLKPFK